MSKEEFKPYVVIIIFIPKKYFGTIKDKVGVKSLEIIKLNQNKENEKINN